MASFTDKLKKFYSDCSEEGPYTPRDALFTEIKRVRDLIVAELGQDGAKQISRAELALENFKDRIAERRSLEDCLWRRCNLQKEILALGSPEDKVGRAIFHYQLACTEMPFYGDWAEMEAVAGDLLCFFYLWYPDTSSQTTQKKLLERLYLALENGVRQRRLDLASSTRLRISLLAA